MQDYDSIDPRLLAEDITGVQMPEECDPNYNWMKGDTRYTISVSNLSLSFVHRAGTLLYQGAEPLRRGKRIHRVVKYDNGVLHYRLCEAMEGSDYEAFMVGWFYPLSELEYAIDVASNIAPNTLDAMVQEIADNAPLDKYIKTL